MIYNTLEKAFCGYPLGPGFEKAIRFVRSLDAGCKLGRQEIDGDKMYANVMEYDTEFSVPPQYEIHRRYVDLQAVITGSETVFMRMAPGLPVKTPYDPEVDCEFLLSDGKAAEVNVQLFPGYFTLLFPHEAHMGKGVTCLGKGKVKKVVVKIAAELLRS